MTAGHARTAAGASHITDKVLKCVHGLPPLAKLAAATQQQAISTVSVVDALAKYRRIVWHIPL
jgi:hypothetical protein